MYMYMCNSELIHTHCDMVSLTILVYKFTIPTTCTGYMCKILR